MSFVVQAFIWILGVGLAIYIAVFSMFIGGLVEFFTVLSEIFNGDNEGVAIALAFSITKVIFASLVGWLIVLVTGTISAIAGEYLD